MILGGPALAAAQTPDAACSLLSRTGDRYAQAPLPGFDPTSSDPLTAPAAPEGASALVLCHRETIVPEPGDYRVPAELHLPLAITNEREVVFLEMDGGRLQASFRRGQPTPEEAAAVAARLEQMRAALAVRPPTSPP